MKPVKFGYMCQNDLERFNTKFGVKVYSSLDDLYEHHNQADIDDGIVKVSIVVEPLAVE